MGVISLTFVVYWEQIRHNHHCEALFFFILLLLPFLLAKNRRFEEFVHFLASFARVATRPVVYHQLFFLYLPCVKASQLISPPTRRHLEFYKHQVESMPGCLKILHSTSIVLVQFYSIIRQANSHSLIVNIKGVTSIDHSCLKKLQ